MRNVLKFDYPLDPGNSNICEFITTKWWQQYIKTILNYHQKIKKEIILNYSALLKRDYKP